jgi:DNA-binding MarR family transcriptional regulator
LKLEEEIKQQKFLSPKHKAVVNIYYTNCYIISQFESFFKKFGITQQQYNILRILRGQRGNAITIGEIKSRMLDKNSDVSRIVERLRMKKLIERKICLNDRRQMHVKITEKGLDLLAQMDDVDKKAKEILSSLSNKEAELLNTLLDKIRR